jgi:hypothetical protein
MLDLRPTIDKSQNVLNLVALRLPLNIPGLVIVSQATRTALKHTNFGSENRELSAVYVYPKDAIRNPTRVDAHLTAVYIVSVTSKTLVEVGKYVT